MNEGKRHGDPFEGHPLSGVLQPEAAKALLNNYRVGPTGVG